MEPSKREKIEVNYIMKFPMKEVWPIFKCPEAMNKVMTELQPKITILNGKRLNEEGCEYKYFLGDELAFYGIVSEIIENESYNFIKTSCRFSFPVKVRYENQFTLFTNSIENNTFIKWEMIYIDWDKDKISNFKTFLENSKNDMQKHFERVKNYLKNKIKLLQIESVIIDKSQQEVWDIISDFNVFIKHVPLVADTAEYIGEPKVIGTKVVLKWLEKKVTCYLKVVLIECDKSNNEWIYRLECYDGIPKIPNQILTFTVMKVNEEKCFLKFKHKFNSKLNYGYIELLSKEKKKILNKLKFS